jgi:hypothetical protein
VQLLVAVLHSVELLDEVLSHLVELGHPDTIVVESHTGLELLERDLPIFAGLRSMIPGGIDFSRLVLCVIEDEAAAREALASIGGLGDGAVAPGEPRNTVFLVPVTGVDSF